MLAPSLLTASLLAVCASTALAALFSPISALPADSAALPDLPKDIQVEPGTPHAWGLLTSAVLFEINGDRHDLLAGREIDAKGQAEIRQVLWDAWDIKKRADLDRELKDLETTGMRTEMEAAMKEYAALSAKERRQRLDKIVDEEKRAQAETLAQHARTVLSSKGRLLAWDYARYVSLCRWGYLTGMLTESEAWDRIDPIARKLQKAYGSWEELGEAYCIGRECWDSKRAQEGWKALEKLKDDAKSPWKTTAWDLVLDAKPKKTAKNPDKH